jgi:hypothetical protein
MAVAIWQTPHGDEQESQDGESGNRLPEAVEKLRPESFTKHARKRAARRNLAPNAVDYVLAHGREIHRTGVSFYFLGRSDMPPADRRHSWASRLEGTIVLVALDGAVITAYRNRRGLRAILRKMKYRLLEITPCCTDDADWRDAQVEWKTA